ncbi:uncharacterized protein N7503_003212 [Penicillium pulvis]|uniref:uncharacterized protein n=1 Tax=Penicillium pulvis TaxID=1562058 RepID=UPI002547CF9A|nr:uncharacterized protein N7503_003212 [Penicillium pulvis]KAJ5805610.1 hypothetical protein N7503_003212 [Penicillium pulvis]
MSALNHIDRHDKDDKAAHFIEDALNEIFTPEEEETKEVWEEHLNGEGLCPEAWLGLLLVRLTHLQTIEFGHEHSDLMSDILLKAANRQQPFHQGTPFPLLQDVRACVGWGASWIDSGFLMPFFYFPTVRRIYGTAIGETKDDENTCLANHQPSCPVQEITVEEGYWCRGMLDWLAVCTNLQHISITVEIQADEYELDEKDQFDAPQFRVALLPFTKTLKTLCIEYGDNYRDQVVDEKDVHESSFGSFKDFTVLENLTVRHDHLMGLSDDSSHDWDMKPLAESLPHSLVSLKIIDIVVDCHLELLSELSQLLRHVHTFPKLERLVLCILSEDEEEISDVFDILRVECQGAGVSLMIE